jgi:hypothetical protein
MPLTTILAIGIYLNSALYLAGCYWAGMIYHNEFAWRAALATFGINYLACMAQLWWPAAEVGSPERGAILGLWAGSILCGAASGLSLLFW